ncbi:MAG TPA: NAD(P)/FAD-dependent oxidoreductase [Kofleriaceae bacterium]|nr:NAD(P)/FAD-dependent oxidoreductase [Kofleriaceae bacterium]
MSRARKAIVVGTGAGGLSAAAHLAKDGFEVVALDQGDRIGGFLAPFSIDGYSFDPGVHYIGQARRGQMLDRLLGGLGIDVERLFVEMDPDGFDVYRFPDLEVRMCRGLERYRDRLIEWFPDDRDGLHHIFDLVAHFAEAVHHWPLAAHRPRLSDLRGLRHLPSVMRWVRSSHADLLAHMLRDPRARAVLAAADANAGLPPSRLAALTGIGILRHYLDGGFYPRGGSGALRDALVEVAARNGAQFRTGADVVEILTRGSAVAGVRLADGERLEADVVVSGIDPTITFGKLLARAALPGRLARKVEHTEPSLGSFTIFLGLRRDLRAHGFGAFNVWQYPSWDLEAAYEPVLAGRIPEQPPLFLSSSTSRDDSGALAPPGCSTLQIATMMPWQPFARWAAVPAPERDADYRQLRQDIAARLLAEVERKWPGLVGDIAVQRVSTPLSNTDYTRAVAGGIYGPAHTVEQMGRWRFGTRTPIHGLVLAGAGALGCGVANCLASGRIAAAVAAGRRTPARRAETTREVAHAAHP